MQLHSKITPKTLAELKKAKQKFACLTAYDAPSARILDEAGIEVVLVGDSLGMTVLGLDSTKSVTLENILYHTKAVRRGIQRALLASDLPFDAAQGTADEITASAKRLIDEGGADAVKIEGPVFETIRKMTSSGVPVISHLGLTPQTAESFRVKAKSRDEAKKLFSDAKEVERCGAFALVLECIPRQLAQKITQALTIPTIGVGAGPETDAQILVWHDCLGINERKPYKFVRPYAHFREEAKVALEEYRRDILSGRFPSIDESFTMKEEDLNFE